jgi:hypothetical protein
MKSPWEPLEIIVVVVGLVPVKLVTVNEAALDELPAFVEVPTKTAL